MRTLKHRTTAVLAVFVVLGGLQPAFASDSLRLKRDLRACIDRSLAAANAHNEGGVTDVLSTCESELRAFTDSLSDETRRAALRVAITGYVQEQLTTTHVARGNDE